MGGQSSESELGQGQHSIACFELTNVAQKCNLLCRETALVQEHQEGCSKESQRVFLWRYNEMKLEKSDLND
jgi:hypothetical protein